MWTTCEIVLWSTASSNSCVMKWTLNLRYFCTILAFYGYPRERHWAVFVFSNACRIRPFLAIAAALSCRLLRKFWVYCHFDAPYMVDIFESLNHVNQEIQGGGATSSKRNEPEGFSKKLPLWKRRTQNDNFVNFPLLNDCVRKAKDEFVINDISVLW